MSKILAVERETIILFNEGEAAAEIEAHNAAMKRRLDIIRRERPEDITLVRRDGYADSYIFPKKWVKIIPPRRATEKQREHLKQARANIKQ
jgi:hypothetical protein